MKEPISLRYIPGWLNNVFVHQNANHHDFEHIVSKHDLNAFQIANYQLRSVLYAQLNISDFVLPDAAIDQKFSEDELTFALFGANAADKTITDFPPTRFKIVPDQYSGIIIIEDNSCEPKDLIAELVKAVALYRGNDVALQSSSFIRYLKDVKKYVQTPLLVLDEIAKVRFMKHRTTGFMSDHPLMLGDPTPPLNT